MSLGFSLVIPLMALLVWCMPFVLIGLSNRTQKNEKAAWLLAVLFISWFAWIFYLLLAPLKNKP